MFRKQNPGRLSFSWNRLVLNTFPNFSNDSKDDVELSPKEQDDLFRLQIVQPEPRILNAQSFFIGGVVGMVNRFSYFQLNPGCALNPRLSTTCRTGATHNKGLTSRRRIPRAISQNSQLPPEGLHRQPRRPFRRHHQNHAKLSQPGCEHLHSPSTKTRRSPFFLGRGTHSLATS